jgi:hypothetical protein
MTNIVLKLVSCGVFTEPTVKARSKNTVDISNLANKIYFYCFSGNDVTGKNKKLVLSQ